MTEEEATETRNYCRAVYGIPDIEAAESLPPEVTAAYLATKNRRIVDRISLKAWLEWSQGSRIYGLLIWLCVTVNRWGARLAARVVERNWKRRNYPQTRLPAVIWQLKKDGLL